MGKPILIGREKNIREAFKNISQDLNLDDVEIQNAAINPNVQLYTDFLYKKLERKGFLYRDCARMVKNDRNVFAACMLAHDHGDALITGLTRNYHTCLRDITRVIDHQTYMFGLSILIFRGRTIFIADTTVNENPTAPQLAEIAIQTAKIARRMGHEPRVAFLSYSSFGNLDLEKDQTVSNAMKILDLSKLDFEYDGEMTADVALTADILKLYPFCKLSQPANILIMPSLHAANISAKLLQSLGGGS